MSQARYWDTPPGVSHFLWYSTPQDSGLTWIIREPSPSLLGLRQLKKYNTATGTLAATRTCRTTGFVAATASPSRRGKDPGRQSGRFPGGKIARKPPQSRSKPLPRDRTVDRRSRCVWDRHRAARAAISPGLWHGLPSIHAWAGSPASPKELGQNRQPGGGSRGHDRCPSDDGELRMQLCHPQHMPTLVVTSVTHEKEIMRQGASGIS